MWLKVWKCIGQVLSTKNVAKLIQAFSNQLYKNRPGEFEKWDFRFHIHSYVAICHVYLSNKSLFTWYYWIHYNNNSFTVVFHLHSLSYDTMFSLVESWYLNLFRKYLCMLKLLLANFLHTWYTPYSTKQTFSFTQLNVVPYGLDNLQQDNY